MTELFHVHMQAPWLINRGLHHLLENCLETADIIHMTDYNALRGSEHHAAYAATKAGLESLTRSFARMYAPGVKVNAIAPYLILMNEGDREMASQQALHVPPMGLEPGEQVIWPDSGLHHGQPLPDRHHHSCGWWYVIELAEFF